MADSRSNVDDNAFTWRSRVSTKFVLLISGFWLLVFGVLGILAITESPVLSTVIHLMPALAVLAGAFVGIYRTIQREKELSEQKLVIAKVAAEVREHPDKPQLAWDLARIKLESYLDRNLSQVKSIFWLTFIVMLAGFAFVLYGLYNAFRSPDALPVSIVASASGVMISFIGGSFLVIYRSILTQSKDYVAVLERINAVGMAVQIIASIPADDMKLKNQTSADLAKQLLQLYSDTPFSNARKSVKPKA